MAKKRGPNRPKFRGSNYFAARIDVLIDLATLAAQTGVRVLTADAVDEKSLVSSIECTYALTDETPTADAGPIDMYVHHPDYTLAEVEAFIENTLSWSRNDMVAQEIANRRIRLIGTFPDSASGVVASAVTLQNGRKIKTKLNWQLRSGQGLGFVAYNNGSAAMATTDADVRISGKANLFEQ